MSVKSIALFATSLIFSTNISAAIISADWNNSGDNLVTQDTTSGLEWLDLTTTTDRSYNDISSKLGAGQEFDGWRYATSAEVAGLFDAFGGDNAYYNSGWSTQNNGLFDAVSALWDDTYCAMSSCPTGDGYSYYILGDSYSPDRQWYGFIYDLATNSFNTNQDSLNNSNYNSLSNDTTSLVMGSALVRTSVVPIPSAVWLFGSGLIGLIGVARRKKS